MDPSTPRFVRTPDAILREIAGETLLVPVRRMRLLDAETLYILDDVGACVWRRLAEPGTLDDLVAAVEEAYDVPPATDVRADLRALLDDLVGQGLVRREDEP